MKRIAWVVLTILWTSFIFYNSTRTGNESGTTSNNVVEIFTGLFKLFNIHINPSSASLLIRKGAHFFEFFILGILIYNVIKNFAIGKRRLIYKKVNIHSFILVLGFCLLVAIIDETIQYFVPDRYASIIDVLIDFVGSLISMFIIVLFNYKNLKSTLNKN